MQPLRISGTANAYLQNKINISGIFNYVREQGPTYRARIARDLKMSAPAVSRAIERLIEDGYVVETTKIITGSGKRPTQVRINADKGAVIGVDLIKERIKLAVSDFSGRMIENRQGFSFDGEIDVCGKLVKEIDGMLTSGGEASVLAGGKPLRAIGIGVPAVVDISTGAVMDAPLYRSLKGVNLKETLEERYRVPVFAENVVNVSAMAEKQYGEGRNYRDMVFIEISDGIGAGIFLDNRLVRGYHGAAGEIGFSVIGADNLGFVADSKGFLERNASLESIREIAAAELASGRWPSIEGRFGGGNGGPDPAFVCEAARSGDEVAGAILQRVVRYLSVVIVNLILALNPEIVVIGGDFCSLPFAAELFLDPIATYVERSLPFEPPKLRKSVLGENAGVIGASCFAIDSILLGEFPYTLGQDAAGAER